nr:MAG TPA: hypothetical protein [Caudoviricetes sp.]
MATPFIIYESWSTLITNLPTEQAGELIQALCARQLEQEHEISDPTVNAIYMMISAKMDEDAAKYSEKSAKKSDAAQKRWSKSKAKASEEVRVDADAMQTDVDVCNSMQMDTDAMQCNANDAKYIYKYNSNSKETHSKECVKKAASQQPPSIDDVRSFARDEGLSGFNADAFWNFYESKDWKIGGEDMADWRSAARCWHARDRNKPTSRAPNNTFLDIPKQDIDYDAIASARRRHDTVRADTECSV